MRCGYGSRSPPVSRRLAVLVLLAVAACDPEEGIDDLLPPPGPAPADPAKQAADAAAARATEAKQAARAKEVDFAACMAGCFSGTSPSPTDRQTCRLTCGADRLPAAGSGPSEVTKAALGRFDTCLDADCRAAGSATDAATCRLTCAQATFAGPAAPPLTEPTRGCAVSCLEHVGDCAATCTSNADDAATCRLQCADVGRRCITHCEADPGAPAKPPTAPAGAAAPPAPPPAPASVPKATREGLPPPP